MIKRTKLLVSSHAVSEHFLTWYDIFRDGRVEIVVFDIEKQEFREREEIAELPWIGMIQFSDGILIASTL